MRITVCIGCFGCFIALMAVFSDIWGTGSNMLVFVTFAGCAVMAVVLGVLFLTIMVSFYDLGLFDAQNRRDYDREENEPGTVLHGREVRQELPLTVHDKAVIEYQKQLEYYRG